MSECNDMNARVSTLSKEGSIPAEEEVFALYIPTPYLIASPVPILHQFLGLRIGTGSNKR